MSRLLLHGIEALTCRPRACSRSNAPAREFVSDALTRLQAGRLHSGTASTASGFLRRTCVTAALALMVGAGTAHAQFSFDWGSTPTQVNSGTQYNVYLEVLYQGYYDGWFDAWFYRDSTEIAYRGVDSYTTFSYNYTDTGSQTIEYWVETESWTEGEYDWEGSKGSCLES